MIVRQKSKHHSSRPSSADKDSRRFSSMMGEGAGGGGHRKPSVAAKRAAKSTRDLIARAQQRKLQTQLFDGLTDRLQVRDDE